MTMQKTFKILQTPISDELVLIPSGDSSVAHTPSAGSNYQCVDDPVGEENEDDDYVYNDADTLKLDLFTLPNHTTETGTINYVKVVCRAKSYNVTAAPDSIYKMCVNSASYLGNNFVLPSGYDDYYYIWTTNPATAVAWTWTNIDDLIAGFQSQSPTVVTKTDAEYTIKPNAAGDVTNIPEEYPVSGAHYALVADSSVLKYVKNTTTTYQKDLYNLQNLGFTPSAITSVTVYAYSHWSLDAFMPKAKLGVKSGSTEDWSAEKDFGQEYTISNTWATNPDTSAAWTGSEVDSMQAGIDVKATTNGYMGDCCRLWVVVTYSLTYQPSLRTTQCYVIVNYQPSEVEVELNQPENLEWGTGHEIWKGLMPTNVYGYLDKGLNENYLTLSGHEPNSATKMETIKDMRKRGVQISLLGLDDGALDTSWFIKNFDYKEIAGSANRDYTWALALEKV